MKRTCVVIVACLLAAGSASAQRMTEAEERARFDKLLEYAATADPPSRHTAHEEMVKFGEWVEGELLSRLPGASIQEQQLFWWVLYDRRCRSALGPALAMLPRAIERCRDAQIATYEVGELRQQMKKAERAGNTALADQLATQIEEARPRVPWNEIVQGDEVAVLCYIVSEFGREEAFQKMVDIAIESSSDDTLAKGERTKHTRTHRDRPLPGGTEMWNTVYRAVWEGLRKLAARPLKKETREAMRAKLTAHFEKLKKGTLSPNQEAAVENYDAVVAALLKSEKTRGDDEEGQDEEQKDDGVGIIRM